MKWILGLSSLFNLYLGVSLYQERSRPPLERIIVEEKFRPMVETMETLPETSPQAVAVKSEKKTKKTSSGTVYMDPVIASEAVEYEEQAQAVESTKKEFFLNLGLTEEELLKQERMKDQFIQVTSKIYQKSPSGELSFEDRRELIRLEEKYQQDLEGLYGKQNWNKFQSYRQKYNEKRLKKGREENTPAILMGI